MGGKCATRELSDHLSDYIIQQKDFARGFLITDVSGFKATAGFRLPTSERCIIRPA